MNLLMNHPMKMKTPFNRHEFKIIYLCKCRHVLGLKIVSFLNKTACLFNKSDFFSGFLFQKKTNAAKVKKCVEKYFCFK